MPFLSYHAKINTKASNYPGSRRNPAAGESRPHVPIRQGPAGQPAVTMETSVNDGILPRPMVTPFSFQRSDSGASCQRHAGSGAGDSTSRGLEQRLWPRCPGGRAVIPLPLALRPCTASSLLGCKQAALLKSLKTAAAAPRTTRSAGKPVKNVCFRYLLTSEADTSLAGAAGAAQGEIRGLQVEEAALVPAGRGL